MRVAALYDIHGNLPALDAVLAELAADPPDAIVIGGDVAAGPQPVEVLAGLPPSLQLDGTSFCHATPRSDEERVTVFSPDERIEELVALAPADLVVAGHTHRQFDRVVDGGRMVNAGSVGRPYEPEPAAYWLRLEPDVRLMRTDYDIEAAAAAFRTLGYPMADGMVTPVDADAIARKYEAASGAPTSPESRAELAAGERQPPH
jgi:predicted phosphodiesterase